MKRMRFLPAYVNSDILRTMNTLSYALLGLLSREPLSGYDLAARFKTSIAMFWAARHSQIYPELARLETQGLVSHERVVQEGRPNKKVFSITKAGIEALRRWVVEPPESPPVRN